jgi:hypothetical protein
MLAVCLPPAPVNFATQVGIHRTQVRIERDSDGTYWVSAGEPGFELVRKAVLDNFGNLVLPEACH